MGGEVDQTSADNRGYFVHRVPEHESTIEYGDLGFVFGNVTAIEVDSAHGWLGPLLVKSGTASGLRRLPEH